VSANFVLDEAGPSGSFRTTFGDAYPALEQISLVAVK
jgi:hypothetical protein